ncbi:MAG: TrbI/VirB10 family protein [Sphingobacteriaceae bacterium]|mgnify:FL=1|nr:TrbI/VirB10 family protein [Sphingobacteriaceae bacterium]
MMSQFNVFHKLKDIKGRRVTILVVVIVSVLVGLLVYGFATTNDKSNADGGLTGNNQKSKIDRSGDDLEATALRWSKQKANNNGVQNNESDNSDSSAPIAQPKAIGTPLSVPPIDQDVTEFNKQVNQLQQEEKLKKLRRQYTAYNAHTLVYTRDGSNTASNNSGSAAAESGANLKPGQIQNDANTSSDDSGDGVKTYTPKYKLGNNYSLIATTIIPSILFSELVSDNSGPVSAMVSDNIYDTQTAHQLLIPQGSMLIGFYDGDVAYGSNRIGVAFRQLCFPNATCIDLAQEPATDVKGSIGLHDMVDNHYWALFGMNFIGSVISSGASYAQAQAANSGGAISSTGDVAQNMGQTTNQVLQRKIKTSPTITIRQGSVIRVMLTNNMVLKPYTK